MDIRPDLEPLVANVAAGHAPRQTVAGKRRVARALPVALLGQGEGAAHPVQVRARAEAEAGPKTDLADAGVSDAAAGHLCAGLAVGHLLVHVDLDAAGGGVDAAPARPAQRDGHHAVHVGQQDGHSDGDRQPRHQGRHEDLHTLNIHTRSK